MFLQKQSSIFEPIYFQEKCNPKNCQNFVKILPKKKWNEISASHGIIWIERNSESLHSHLNNADIGKRPKHFWHFNLQRLCKQFLHSHLHIQYWTHIGNEMKKKYFASVIIKQMNLNWIRLKWSDSIELYA